MSNIVSMSDENNLRYSLDELAALVDVPRRTLRYYIQHGLVDRPIGEKRGAYYTSRHVEQLLELRKWQQAGLSLERIREVLYGGEAGDVPPPQRRTPGSVEVWSHLYVADGVEVVLEPSRAQLSPEAVRAFTRGVMALYQTVQVAQKEGKDDA